MQLLEVTNMDTFQLAEWARDPRSRMASSRTGFRMREWLILRGLSGTLTHWDEEDNENALLVVRILSRHTAQRARLFGQEVKTCGYSKRHICLKNLGLDVTRPALSIDLTGEDLDWSEQQRGGPAAVVARRIARWTK